MNENLQAQLNQKTKQIWVQRAASHGYISQLYTAQESKVTHVFFTAFRRLGALLFYLIHLCSSPGDPVTINAPNSIAGGKNCNNGRTQYHSALFQGLIKSLLLCTVRIAVSLGIYICTDSCLSRSNI